MQHLYYDFHLSAGDVVEINLDRQANVRLLDNVNYSKFRRGDRHKYVGGLATTSPFVVSAPRSGHWHLVIDRGSRGGQLRAGVRVL